MTSSCTQYFNLNNIINTIILSQVAEGQAAGRMGDGGGANLLQKKKRQIKWPTSCEAPCAGKQRMPIAYKIGTLIIRTGFWGVGYHNYKKETQNSIGSYLGPYSIHCMPKLKPSKIPGAWSHPECLRSKDSHPTSFTPSSPIPSKLN